MAPPDEPYYPVSGHRDPRCFDDRPGKLHMYVAPNEIQIGNSRDAKNRRLINLVNVPLGYNYIAPQINDGDEFAIGGDNAHIVETLANHLKYRSDEAWHIVAIPESHIRNLKIMPKASHAGVAGQGGSFQVSGAQANQQNTHSSSGPGATVAHKQKTQDEDEVPQLKRRLAVSGIQTGYAQQNAPGQNDQPLQQSQQGSGYSKQGSFGGFGLGSPQTSELPQTQQFSFSQLSSFGSLGQNNGQASSLSQAQQTGFPPQSNSSAVGHSGLFSAQPTASHTAMAQNTQAAPHYDALAPGAETFYKPGEDDWIFDPAAFLNQPGNGATGPVPEDEIRLTPLLQPPTPANELDPTVKVLRAHADSPGRFEDKSGTGWCDWCGRCGHEAVDCLRWDPQHFDKAACVMCNNAAHGIDECPRFVRLEQEMRAFILLDKGAGRPGVRSRFHAWTDYCTRDYWGGGFPMTRRFVRGLAQNERTGPVVQNMWKVWDYRRGVPREFRDTKLDSVKKIVLAGLDERFQTERPFSVYGQHGSSLRVATGASKDKDEDCGEDDECDNEDDK